MKLVQKMPQTNTEQINKSSAKKHPRFQLATYPAYTWAAITRDPHHGEWMKNGADSPWNKPNNKMYTRLDCLETIHLRKNSQHMSACMPPVCGSKVLKLWMCFQAHRAGCGKGEVRIKADAWLICGHKRLVLASPKWCGNGSTWNAILCLNKDVPCPRMHFCLVRPKIVG